MNQDWINLWDESQEQDVWSEWDEWTENPRNIRREDRKIQQKLAHRELRREIRNAKARR